MKTSLKLVVLLFAVASAFTFYSCKPKGPQGAIVGNAASKVYVAPGQYDEFYNIVSGASMDR
jgi:nitrous-oxide reductase